MHSYQKQRLVMTNLMSKAYPSCDKLIEEMRPLIHKAFSADVDSLADHLSHALDVDKATVTRALNSYYRGNPAPRTRKVDQVKIVNKGTGITLVADSSSIIVLGDTAPLSPWFSSLGYLLQTRHIKHGKIWSLDRKDRTLFKNALSENSIEFTETKVEDDSKTNT